MAFLPVLSTSREGSAACGDAESTRFMETNVWTFSIARRALTET
jgi:hypothetical protein